MDNIKLMSNSDNKKGRLVAVNNSSISDLLNIIENEANNFLNEAETTLDELKNRKQKN